MTLGAVIFGITLSTLHQSGLGALFLMAKAKIHPLWYSEFIPILFFVSSIAAGLSMIIVEGTISHRVFKESDRSEATRFVRADHSRAGQGRDDLPVRLLLLQGPDLHPRAPVAH